MNKKLSYLRVVACCAILILHTVFTANGLYADQITAQQNIISRVVVNEMMWAVPVFLMVSGSLLLQKDRKISYQKLFRKYIARVFWALVIFSVLDWCFDLVMNHTPFTGEAVMSLVKDFFQGKGWAHLWYLYLLIGIYLMVPFLKRWIDGASTTDILYMLALLFLFQSLIPLLEAFVGNVNFYILFFTVYLLYFIAGYAIERKILTIPTRLSLSGLIGSTVLLAFFTILRWKSGNTVPDFLFGYSSPLIVIQSLCLFGLSGCQNHTRDREKKDTPRAFERFLLWIDSVSFGIYLIHMFFVRLFLRYMGWNFYARWTLLQFTAFLVGLLAISSAISYGLKRTFLRKIL
ncbi:MAG: acyltransferase family protein [Peptoniphilaceae bacterium]|nr:acyltransferase family protein [Peptoniphilaceae bacterium]